MLSYNEAKELYERQYEHVNSLLKEQGINDFIFVQVRLAHNLSLKLDPEIQKAIISLNFLKYELLSYPDIFNKVRYWLIMITGGNNEINHRIKNRDYTNGEQVEEIMQEIGGEIMSKVSDFVAKNNFKLLSNCVGGGTWNITCHCTNKEAMLLCNMVRETFPNEIDNDYIKLKRMMGFLSFI